MVGELHFTGDLDSARQADFLTRVCELLGLPRQVQLKLVGVNRDQSGGHTIDYAATKSIRLNGSEYGVADGVTIEEETTARLYFDAAGRLGSFHLGPFDEHHVQRIRNQVKRLAAADEIAAERPNADPSAKPWYVETDARGVKRLKRAHIA
jgi:hypothetical protein